MLYTQTHAIAKVPGLPELNILAHPHPLWRKGSSDLDEAEPALQQAEFFSAVARVVDERRPQGEGKTAKEVDPEALVIHVAEAAVRG